MRSQQEPRTELQRLVCECLAVTEREIRAAVRKRELDSVDDVTACTGAGGGCISCHREISRLIVDERGQLAEPICSAR